MQTIQESFAFKQFIEDLENNINIFLQNEKKGWTITGEIHLYERALAAFIINRNIGYGGRFFEYELVTMIKEGSVFTEMTSIKSAEELTNRKKTSFFVSTIKYQILGTDGHYNESLETHRLRTTVSEAHDLVKKNNDVLYVWETIAVVPQFSYKLSSA